MRMPSPPFSGGFFISFLVAAFFSIHVVLVSGQCRSDQGQLLLQLKSGFNSSSTLSGKLATWDQTTDCCSWDGVACGDAGLVIGLDLRHQSIAGVMNDSSSLFRLQHLQRLDLAYNRFKSAFPSAFDKLRNLSYLNLSNAGFTGQIPAVISSMAKLVSLDLSGSSLLGISVKLENPNLEMLVRNLTKLKVLNLDGVNISARGNEWCRAVSSLTDLQVLSMSSCYLSGPMDSSLSNLQSLSVIRLDKNSLYGPVPQFFAKFSKLTSLRLSSSGLSGTLPEEILLVPTLQILDVSDNKLLEGSFQEFHPNASLQTLTLSGTKFGGQLPESIGNLGQLTRIELVSCNFSGTIPKTVSKLTRLVYLDFSANNFSGPMPSFSSLRNLTVLNLASNQLSGSIHSTNWSVLSNLVRIDLQNNTLSGTIPSTLFGIPSLQKILLSQNQFNGSLGDLNGKTAFLLDTLDLSRNKLQGQFPMYVFELQGLKILTMSSNNLSGFIQWTDIQKLRNLSNLDLSYNNLFIDATSIDSSLFSIPNITTLKLASCNLKQFPGFLKTQLRINYLDLSENQISGEIPNWVWEFKSLAHLNLSLNFLTKFEGPLQKNITPSLSVVDLHGNQLQGQIDHLPPHATYLDYSRNNFSSSLPHDIGDFLRFAYFFSLSDSNLHEGIPRSICNSSYLQVLDLSNNSLSGPIPECLFQMSGSVVLNLRRNYLSGIISDTFPVNCSLQTLDLNRNLLQGKVPKSLVNCKMLEVLDLGNNQVNDTFPCHLKNITRLRVLVLRANKFNGKMHCSEKSPWHMLQIVDISSNSFSGTLHETCLSTWKAMQAPEDETLSDLNHLHFKVLKFGQFYYEDAITVTMKGLELELLKILTVFTSIDISCNNFEGPIPEVIGTFKALYILNFSHNALTGVMPPFLGNLSQLESLDLSRNNLHGEIPIQIVKLNFLSVFNVSNNKLVGRIPTGTQIQSFSEASFANNPGLCGLPLTADCSNEPSPVPHTAQKTDEFDWQFILIGVGFGVGTALFVAPLIFWKTASKLVDDNIDKFLRVMLPKVGWTYMRPDDWKVDTDEKLEEDNTESDDEEDKESEETVEEYHGRYCVFCSKLDMTKKKAIHDLSCTCHDSSSVSSPSSTSSHFSP